MRVRTPLIAGNWKMHKTIREALDFVQTFRPLVVSAANREIVIAPPFTAIKAVAGRLEGCNISVAAQAGWIQATAGSPRGIQFGLTMYF